MCIILLYTEFLGTHFKLHQTREARCLIHLLNNWAKTPIFSTFRLLKLFSLHYKEFCSTWWTWHVCIRKNALLCKLGLQNFLKYLLLMKVLQQGLFLRHTFISWNLDCFACIMSLTSGKSSILLFVKLISCCCLATWRILSQFL